jgi:hypothetical protein
VQAVRDAHPAWGAPEIASYLERTGLSPSALLTIHEILHRNSRIKPAVGGSSAARRFEMPEPNMLWQMEFRCWIQLDAQCHTLTVVDDHSR